MREKRKKEDFVAHLSQVILRIEEVCVLCHVNHFLGEIFGFVDDSQVKQPARTKTRVPVTFPILTIILFELFFLKLPAKKMFLIGQKSKFDTKY